MSGADIEVAAFEPEDPPEPAGAIESAESAEPAPTVQQTTELHAHQAQPLPPFDVQVLALAVKALDQAHNHVEELVGDIRGMAAAFVKMGKVGAKSQTAMAKAMRRSVREAEEAALARVAAEEDAGFDRAKEDLLNKILEGAMAMLPAPATVEGLGAALDKMSPEDKAALVAKLFGGTKS